MLSTNVPCRRRGHDAKHHAERDGDDDGADHQQQGSGQAIEDEAHHRSLLHVGIAEIEPDQLAEIDHELDEQRLVEAEFVAKLGHVFGARSARTDRRGGTLRRRARDCTRTKISRRRCRRSREPAAEVADPKNSMIGEPVTADFRAGEDRSLRYSTQTESQLEYIEIPLVMRPCTRLFQIFV